MATRLLASGSVARLLVSLTVVSIGAATFSALAYATHLQYPPPIVLAAKTDTQRAAQESFCVFAPPDPGQEVGVTRCVDYVDMPPRRLSSVRWGAPVTISFRGASSVTDGYARIRVLGRQRFFHTFALDGPETRWRVRLRPGKYEVEVFGRFRADDGRFGDTSGSLGLRVRRPQPVSGAVVGSVVDGCGRPVVRADVAVTRTHPVVSVPLIAIHTNARGRYYYPELQPARYWITVRARGFRAQTKTVTVRAGQSSRLNFRFRRCAMPELAG